MLIRLMGCALIGIILLLACESGKTDDEDKRNETEIWMEHTHGGDPDDPA